LRTVHIYVEEGRDVGNPSDYGTFFKSLWNELQPIAHNVKTFLMSGHLRGLASVSLPKYFDLQELTVILRKDNIPEYKSILAGTILPFVNHNTSTLRSLKLKFPKNAMSEHFLRGLTDFSHLEKIEINTTMNSYGAVVYDIVPSLYDFLSKYLGSVSLSLLAGGSSFDSNDFTMCNLISKCLENGRSFCRLQELKMSEWDNATDAYIRLTYKILSGIQETLRAHSYNHWNFVDIGIAAGSQLEPIDMDLMKVILSVIPSVSRILGQDKTDMNVKDYNSIKVEELI
ncbi:hypothetical protein BDQ17DRAFT_1505688, partial [Cyathus striatus]